MMSYAGFVLRFLFGLVFIYSGATKIAEPAGFAASIFQYQILPDTFIYPVALFLPWLEAVCGLCLWAGAFSRGAAAILNALLAVFMLALGLSMWRGTDIDCGCFGGGGSSAREALIRDGLLLLMGIVVQIVAGREDPPKPKRAVPPKPPKSAQPKPEPKPATAGIAPKPAEPKLAESTPTESKPVEPVAESTKAEAAAESRTTTEAPTESKPAAESAAQAEAAAAPKQTPTKD